MAKEFSLLFPFNLAATCIEYDSCRAPEAFEFSLDRLIEQHDYELKPIVKCVAGET